MLNNQARLEHGSYFADVLQTNSGAEPFWYYIIQRNGSNVIIDVVRFETREEALAAANNALVALNKAAGATAE